MNMEVQISSQDADFNSFEYTPRSGFSGTYGSSIFSFFEEPPYCFPRSLYHCTFPPTVYKGSSVSTSSPALVIFLFCFIYNIHPNRGKAISYCGLGLCFSDV